MLEILNKEQRSVNTVVVRESFWKESPFRPFEAFIANDRALIVGDWAGGSRVVLVKLEPPHEVLESIWCYHPAVSNDETKVVSVSRSYRYSPETHTTVLSVLDASDSAHRSTVVYPPDNAARQDAFPREPDPEKRRALGSRISWSPDDSRLVFFEAVGEESTGKRRIQIVEIDLEAGLQAPRYRQKVVDLDQFVKPDTKKPDRLRFAVEGVTWLEGNASFVVKLHQQYYWKCDRLTYSLAGDDIALINAQ